MFSASHAARTRLPVNSDHRFGFHNQSAVRRRGYARKFLCTLVSISAKRLLRTAKIASFLRKYNDLERTCLF